MCYYKFKGDSHAQPPGFFTANQLRAIALFCMLLDHMWATIVPGREWMTCVGRIAFPIFAFELAQGLHPHP